MNDLGKKKLRTWLQKSLADHPENDNGLVAYVEAIVGDAEGEVCCVRFGCHCLSASRVCCPMYLALWYTNIVFF